METVLGVLLLSNACLIIVGLYLFFDLSNIVTFAKKEKTKQELEISIKENEIRLKKIELIKATSKASIEIFENIKKALANRKEYDKGGIVKDEHKEFTLDAESVEFKIYRKLNKIRSYGLTPVRIIINKKNHDKLVDELKTKKGSKLKEYEGADIKIDVTLKNDQILIEIL